MLGKDRKTIERWMKRASMDALEDAQDGRFSLLTREQVMQLARLHHVGSFTWSDERRATSKPAQLSTDTLVAVEQRVKRLEEQVEALEARLHQYVDAQMAALEQRLRESVPPRPSPPQSFPPAAKPPRRHPRAARTPTAPTTGMSGIGLPPGLELWRDYARRHGLSPSTVQEARDKGKLSMVKGAWLVERHWITEALDAAGQQRFWKLWGQRPDLHRCEVSGCLCLEHVSR
jgi:hypothetical protein